METIWRKPAVLVAVGAASALMVSLAGPVAAQPNIPTNPIIQAALQDDAPPIMITWLGAGR